MGRKKTLAALIFLGLIVVAALAGRIPWPLAGLYLAMSTISVAAYAIDKRAARRQRRRTPESTLHTLAICGGWPGAVLAQEALRHKTRKTAFRRLFWLTVVVNLAALAGLLLAPGDVLAQSSLSQYARLTTAAPIRPA